MLLSRVLLRVSRNVAGRRSLLLPSASLKQPQLNSLVDSGLQPVTNQSLQLVSRLYQPASNSFRSQSFGFASSASPEPTENEKSATERDGQGKANGDEGSASASRECKESVSDSDSEDDVDLSRDDLLKLVVEKDDMLKARQEEFERMKDKFLRALAENENVMERTKREAENSKKYAIQNFAKGLLDVADNLARASSVFKESFAKIDTSKDSAGVVPLVKSLSEGVDMTEKQLGEVFKKFGLEKFDPTNEPFDPHRHNAVFQVPDASKPPGTVAHVLKAGYMLHERVVRPAEVGVTVNNEEESKND
ncbi:GrpE protein homolog 1, mitochondrial [Linum perenne]